MDFDDGINSSSGRVGGACARAPVRIGEVAAAVLHGLRGALRSRDREPLCAEIVIGEEAASMKPRDVRPALTTPALPPTTGGAEGDLGCIGDFLQGGATLEQEPQIHAQKLPKSNTSVKQKFASAQADTADAPCHRRPMGRHSFQVERFAALVKEHGQKRKLARQLGVEESAVTRWSSGQAQPEANNLFGMSIAFQRSWAWFFGVEESAEYRSLLDVEIAEAHGPTMLEIVKLLAPLAEGDQRELLGLLRGEVRRLGRPTRRELDEVSGLVDEPSPLAERAPPRSSLPLDADQPELPEEDE